MKKKGTKEKTCSHSHYLQDLLVHCCRWWDAFPAVGVNSLRGHRELAVIIVRQELQKSPRMVYLGKGRCGSHLGSMVI